jgi:hypothetical protein
MPNCHGKKASYASQFVRTRRPTLSGCSTTTIWQMAPPVSLPTRVTSRRSSAATKSATSRATPRGLRSVSGLIGTACTPSGNSGTTHLNRPERPATTSLHSRPLASMPCTNTSVGPLPISL